jgi:molybdenum cofactor guanylyltransferase
MTSIPETAKPDVTGIVLAGGRSSRFGQDKGLFPFRGKPMVLHAIDILQPCCGEIIISTNRPDDYRFTGLQTIFDIHPGCGPIGGMHSGLWHASFSKVLFLGCDMPLVPAALMVHLLQQLNGCQAVVPSHNGFRETLCMAMLKEAHPITSKAIEEKQFRILDVLDMMETCYTEVSREPFFREDTFFNINYRRDIDRDQE